MMSFHHALLLLICAHLVTSAPIVARRGVKDFEMLVEFLNTARVAHAKERNIGNMHELVEGFMNSSYAFCQFQKYDHELEKVAKSMAKNCKFPHGEYILLSEKYDHDSAMERLTHPLQTKFACVEEAKCPNRGIEHPFCLVGPYRNISLEDEKTGPLGSHCDYGLADNGLCKAGPGNVATSSRIDTELKSVNDMRVRIAKEKNIGNMHEWTVDPELEKLAHSMISDCKFRSGPYIFAGDRDYEKIVEEQQSPTQTKYACVFMVAPCLDRNIERGICLFGPRNYSTRDGGAKFGPLGSHCDHGVADNGLCKAGKEGVVVSYSKTDRFIEESNKMRAKTAKKNHIGNMHEVTLDPELEKIAHTMEADCKFPTGPYVLIPSENQSDDERAKQMSHFVHPLQTKIACVEMAAPCPGRDNQFCLLGPHTSPATEKDKKTGPLGSHCKNGVADNGLCKAK
ncbi:hypothetical protein CAEBREN_23057 [Caenorhabditis brenneri]|uniref:Uncharacterized protein n=1 Tax=Caenorhabditis brenneri TaxID=135651 RepID=G0N2I0_CAEBE|nr:hypothetical protein CAEBREN_23057 [Caenorhabditis brenneri]